MSIHQPPLGHRSLLDHLPFSEDAHRLPAAIVVKMPGYVGAVFTVANSDSTNGLSFGVRGRANSCATPRSWKNVAVDFDRICAPRPESDRGMRSAGTPSASTARAPARWPSAPGPP